VSNYTQWEDGPPLSVQVTLNEAPSQIVTVSVTTIGCERQHIVPASASFIFTNVTYSINQTLQIYANNDNVVRGNSICELVLQTSTKDPYFDHVMSNVTITLIEDDEAGIVITNGSLPSLQQDNSQLMIKEGTSGYFGIMLHSQPLDNVVALFSVASGRIHLSPSEEIHISQWNITQSVHVNAPENGIAEGPQWGHLTITLATTDQVYKNQKRDIDFLVLDDDIPEVFQVSPPLRNTTDRGGTAMLHVVLALAIDAPIHINIFSTRKNIATVQPSQLTFKPNQVGEFQSVEITGIVNNIITGNQTYDVRFEGTGIGLISASVALSNIDMDYAALNCSKSYLIVNELGMRWW